MKKTIFKIMFLFLMVFIYTKVVYADLNCSNSKTVYETSFADPTGMHAYMPVCGKRTLAGYTPVPGKSVPTAGFPEGQQVDDSNFDQVRTRGDRLDDAFIKRADGKGVIKTQVVVCGSKDAYIKGTVKCTYIDEVPYTLEAVYKDVTTTTCKKKSDSNNGDSNSGSTAEKQSGYIINPKVSPMKAEALPVEDDTEEEECTTTTTSVFDHNDKVCPENYFLAGSGDDEHCEAEQEYTYEKDKIDKKSGTKITEKEAKEGCKKAVGFKCKCDTRTAVYTFMCPVYKCSVTNDKLQLCTASFQSPSGDPLYCVNPGQFFSNGFSTTGQYAEDRSFNVMDCETSYSTVDCGYSNILIEGRYYNIPNKTIETALRLWGVHTQQAGFDAIGLSIRSGESCQDPVYFMRTGGDKGDVINPYVETYKYFSKEILKDVRFSEEINPTQNLSKFFIACDSSKLGVACGDETPYQQALALLANTVLGNSHMKEHLKKLFGDEISEKPDSVELITDGVNSQEYIEIKFDELSQITHDKNVKIDCKKLSQMVKNGEITQTQKEQIEAFCKVEAYLVDRNGKKLKQYGGGTPAYCYKNLCRVKIERFAVCDVDESIPGPVQINVGYPSSKTSEGIKKYISCSNPNDNQILMGFNISATDEITNGTSSASKPKNNTSETYPIVNFKCQNQCDDYDIRKNIKDRCDDDYTNYGGSFTSTIKDPSLKCILNMGNAAYKNAYNYSDNFEIGNKFCRIYCSDEISYHIADKIRETSGRIFYYDIETTVRTTKDAKHLFSNIVQLKRTCVSEIYYSTEFAESVNWKKIYNLGTNARGGSDGITDEQIAGIKNFQTLFEVLKQKAQTEGGRTENLNKVLYDLANCNLYTEEEIKNMGIVKPKKYKAKNIKQAVIEKFSSDNNYGIGVDSNCEINPSTNKNDCVKMNNISYEFGASPDGKSVSMKSVTKINSSTKNLSYCSGSNCFKWDPDDKEHEYDYPTSKTSSTDTLNVSDLGNSGQVLQSGTITIPTNDYVLFDVVADVTFYNASRFDVKPSGEVITKGKEKGKNYMSLDAYTFPVDYMAYTSSVCTDREELKKIGYKRCAIYQTYDKVETFFRRNPGDAFYNEVNLAKKFGCYVDVEIPTTECDPTRQICRQGTTYRNVDVGNMFPSSSDGYTTVKNSNWGTRNGKEATDKIESRAEKIGVTDEYLQYSIVLSPTQIKNIKEYNKENGTSYVSEEKLNCQIIDRTYQKCTSPFLERLRESKDYGTMDPKYSGNIKE